MISPKHILLICQLWAAVGAYPAWKDLQPGNKYKDFTFLGKGPSSTPLLNNNFNESVYFTAAGHLKWTEARDTCLEAFGTDGALVDIESPEELQHLFLLIRERVGNPNFESFWTGAYFDPLTSKYVWPEGGNVEDGGWIPFAPNEPSRNDDRGRLFLKKVENDEEPEQEPVWEMFSEIDTSEHGFICEVKERNNGSERPPDCKVSNDLIIILESSQRVENVFTQAKEEFILQIAANWKQYDFNRLAFILNRSNGSDGTANCDTEIRFELDKKFGNDFERAAVIKQTAYVDVPTTRTSCPLPEAMAEFERTSNGGGERTVVILTSGAFTDRSQVVTEVEKLQSKNVKIFALGMIHGIGNDLKVFADKEGKNISERMDVAWMKDKLQADKNPCA